MRAYCVEATNFVEIAESQTRHASVPSKIEVEFKAQEGNPTAVEAIVTAQNMSESMFAASLRMSAQTLDTFGNVRTWRSQVGGTAVCTNCARILIAPVPGRTQRIIIDVVLKAGAFSQSSDDSSDESSQPLFTRMLRRYDKWSNSWAERNALHTKAIEQAALDRNLFHNSQPSPLVDLSFPEIFNTGSPYNVPAGHGANLNELIAHYHRKNAEQDAKTRARLDAKAANSRQPEQVTPSGSNPQNAPASSAISPSNDS
ncbi:MAG: hypothetical protein Q9219_002574 [cf. Caloplaca sp. 3 TL-2023]